VSDTQLGAPGSLDDTRRDGPRTVAASGRRRPPWWLVAVGILLLARVIAIVVLLNSGVEDEFSILGGDARRYEVILESDGTPYRDFEVEYPPVTLALVHLLGGDDVLDTLTRLAISQLVFEMAIAALLAWGWSRRVGVAYLVLGTPFIFFPFPYARIDLFTVFLAVLGLALLRRRFDRAGGIGLAVAALAKLWPLVVAPILLVTRRGRAFWAWLATLAVGMVVWLAAFGPSGLAQVATFRGSKGWQIESIVGVFFHMADQPASHVEQGAWRTGAEVPLLVKPVLPALALGNAALAWWWARARVTRAGHHDDDEAVWSLAPLASIVGLLVFSTIISPQYVLWFAPFVAILAARGERVITTLYLAVAVLTTFILGSIHGQIEGELYATVPIIVRNALLVGILAIALWRLSPRSQPVSMAEPEVQSAGHEQH
jgi:hypothetical protein